MSHPSIDDEFTDATILQLRAQLKAAEERAAKAEGELLGLLARVHRDGGHYTEAHGIEKSCADADTIVAELLAERATLTTGNLALKTQDPCSRCGLTAFCRTDSELCQGRAESLELQGRVAALTAENERLEQNNEKLDLDLNDWRETALHVQKQRDEARGKVASLESERDSALQRIAEMNGRISLGGFDSLDHLFANRDALCKLIDDRWLELLEKNACIADLERHLADEGAANVVLTERVGELGRRVEGMGAVVEAAKTWVLDVRDGPVTSGTAMDLVAAVDAFRSASSPPEGE